MKKNSATAALAAEARSSPLLLFQHPQAFTLRTPVHETALHSLRLDLFIALLAEVHLFFPRVPNVEFQPVLAHSLVSVVVGISGCPRVVEEMSGVEGRGNGLKCKRSLVEVETIH